MSIALIDADIAAYRASAGAQQLLDWGDTPAEDQLTVDPEGAAEAALQTIKAWATLAGCKDVICCLTGRNNFRKIVLPTYKANRAGKSKPLAYVYVVNAIKARYDHRLVEGLEADDLMGIMLTSPKYDGAVCVTLDKDLRGIPGRHFNPLKDRKTVRVTERAADYQWLTQTLTGDVTDGYSGIPKIGPKKAAAILGAPGRTSAQMWPNVQDAFLKAKLTSADALTQARVARILRASDYDKETKSVLLWHPKDAEPLCIKEFDNGL